MNIRIVLFFLSASSLSHLAYAQQGQWTWISGPDLYSSTQGLPVFGTQGVASPDNLPSVVATASTWVDLQGKFWLLGGDCSPMTEYNSASNNLWKYDPDIKQWTWMKGSGPIENVFPFQMAVYGTQGIAADSVTPLGNHEGFEHHVTWTCNDGNLWLLESDDITGKCAMWKYTIASNQWSWMHGNIAVNYGTQGVSSSTNNPEKFGGNPRKGWVDDDGNLWYFDGINGGVMWKYSITDNQWTWMNGTPNTAGTGIFSPIVYGTKGVFDSANQPGSCSATQTWKACDGTFYMFGPLWGNSITEYSTYAISAMWCFNPELNQWAWVGGNTTLNFVPQFDAPYATFPSNFGDACTFDPAYFPVNAVQFNGSNNTWTGHDGRLYGYQQSESFLWCYDPAINEFALVHGDLAPCCDWDDLFAGFTPEYGTLGEPSLDNSPGGVAGPSWVDLDGNFWMLMPLFYDPTPDSWGCGPMMRFMPDPTCLGVGSALTVDSVSIEAYNSYTNPLGDIYTQGGQYTYTLGQTGGCPIQVVLNLTIIPDLSFEFPNVITPNSDGTNDIFEIENLPENTEVLILNRWGIVVFSSDNYQNNWDGKDNSGRALVDGVYTYKFTTKAGKTGHGFVHLVR